MNAVSIIPAPVAAEISGPGSFFGSCQIAAGGFESYLQSASETQIGLGASVLSEASIVSGAQAEPEVPAAYGAALETSKMPTYDNTPEYSEIFLEFVSILKGYKTYKEPSVLSRLKEELGEEEGEEAFKTIKEFFEKYKDKFTVNDGGDDPKFSEAMQILFRLIKALDPKYMSEVPVEEQQVGLEGILKEILEKIVEEIKELLASKQQPEAEILQLEPASEQRPKPEIPQPKPEILRSKKPNAQPETENMFLELVNILNEYNSYKEPLLLSQLKKEFGEEAGEEAFKIIKEFFEKYKAQFTANDGGDDPKFPEAIQILFRLIKALDPKYMQEAPTEEPQAGLESALKEVLGKIVEEIKRLLASGQQPETEILQSEIETAQPKPEKPETTQIETDEEPAPIKEPVLIGKKMEDPRITRLANELIELGYYDRRGLLVFDANPYRLINDLLEQGLLSLDDLGEPEEDKTIATPVAVAPENGEKKEPGFFVETLKNLWESIKNKDEPKKEELLSLLKEIAVGRESGRQLRENLGTLGTEQNTETLDKALDSVSKKEGEFKENELNLANLVKPAAKHSEVKHERHEKPVQPEVRAVWEGSALKIEIVNPKTGEKLQTVETAMPHRMQERIHEFEVIKQIAAQARFTTTPTGEQRLTIQLRPEHLGQVDLRITLNNGEMQIHARVESPTAQNALESHIGLLRDSLEKQGINLERLEVSVEQRDRNAYALAQEHEHENQQHGEKNKKRKHGRTSHLAVSIARDESADTGRRLGYNTMEYLA